MRNEVVHEVDRHGNLFFLASAFIGAVNKIGDALIRAADNDQKLRALAARIGQSTDKLNSAVSGQTPPL